MLNQAPRELPQRFVFFLVPKFSLIALTASIEPMRLANRITGKELFKWDLVSADDEAVMSSSGIPLSPTCKLDDIEQVFAIAVVSGVEVQYAEDTRLISWLRRMDRKGISLGAVCTASHILARAGLLDGYNCTIHWENLPGFTEEFPDLNVVPDLFEIDRNRFTCSGGTAAIDMMLNLIAMQHGHELSTTVADHILHERIRDENDQQRMSLPARLGVRHPKLLDVIQLMEENLEEPLTRMQLARDANLSTRQLERLFRKYLNRSPARYYLELRLNKARLLLLQTNMSVIDVALACGFVSASHFSKCYRDFFGKTPRKERGLPSLPHEAG